MPEPPAWRYQSIIRPLYGIAAPHRILQGGRVLTCVGDEVIEQGFVEIADGRVCRVGALADLRRTQRRLSASIAKA